MKEPRKIRYKPITLDLNIARTNEKFELAGYNLAVLSIDGTADLRFNETTAEAIALAKVKYIESCFERFYITNTAQAGKTLILVVGEENFKLVPV